MRAHQQRRKPPLSMRCAGCGRERGLSTWSGYAPSDLDPKLVHHTQDNSVELHGIHCTCGHYTSYGRDPLKSWGLGS